MAQEAKIRVSLDTSGARRDLEGLYGDMRRAPGIQAPGIGGGGVGGAGGAGGRGGGGLGGGFNIARMLPALLAGAAFGRDSIATAGTLGGSLTGGVSGRIEEALFGNLGPEAKGRNRAASEVAGQLGMARGMGLLGDDQANSLFNAIKPLYEAEERGKRELERNFADQNAGDTAVGLLSRIADVLDRIANTKFPWE